MPPARTGTAVSGPFRAMADRLMPRLLLALFLVALWPAGLDAAEDERLKKLGFLVQEGFVESPGFSTEDAAGNRVDFASFRGKLVLLNFWATWCPPCRLEMPSMERLYGEFRDKGLEVVAVNFMESGEQVRAFAEEQKLTYPMLLDKEAEIAGRYGVMRLPVSVLIGRKGEVIAKAIGFKDWYKDDIRELVATLLGNGTLARAAAADNGAEEPALSEGYSLAVFAGAAVLVLAGFTLLRVRRRRAREPAG